VSVHSTPDPDADTDQAFDPVFSLMRVPEPDTATPNMWNHANPYPDPQHMIKILLNVFEGKVFFIFGSIIFSFPQL
jgi:hypothetical protein